MPFPGAALTAVGTDAHMFWDVAKVESNCADDSAVGCTISGPVTLDKTDPDYYITHASRRFPKSGTLLGTPERITLKLRLRPVGRDVLDDLVESGDLSASIRDAMPVLELWPNRGTSDVTLEWTPAATENPLYGFTKTLVAVSWSNRLITLTPNDTRVLPRKWKSCWANKSVWVKPGVRPRSPRP